MVLSEIISRVEEWRKKRESILNVLNSIGYNFQGSNSEAACGYESFPLRATKLKEIKVVCIMDRFTLDSYTPECLHLEITPQNWKSEINEFKPDMLFIESAWKGKDDLWYRKIDRFSQEIFDLCSYCQDHNIPIVFWNKEDPIYTDSFMATASLADVVFTTDIGCISKYKAELEHDRVYHLHFAAQPLIHNPIKKYERKDKFCFAGAYYHKYKKRAEVFDNFSKVFIKTKGFDIYDRNYQNARPEHAFPQEYDPYIIGKLEPQEIDVAYKGYYFGVNMNSVDQSQTMFARRSFELLASNTIVVGNFSRGVKNYFGDLTICTNDEKTLEKDLDKYTNMISLRKYRLLGLREALSAHLYEDRLSYIIEKVFGQNIKSQLPEITVIAKANSVEESSRLQKMYLKQTYQHSRLIIIYDKQPENISNENITVLTSNQLRNVKIRDLAEGGYIAYFNMKDWYGPNYLLDLILTTKYGKYSVIGKAAYFEIQNDKAVKFGDDVYCPVRKLAARRSIAAIETVGMLLVEDMTAEAEWKNEDMFSVDEFNYCSECSGSTCQEAEDMVIADKGIPLEIINRYAEQIEPAPKGVGVFEINAKTLSQVNIPKNIPVRFDLRGKQSVIKSRLPEGQHAYVYLEKMHELNTLPGDGDFPIKFCGKGNLDLICVCIFYNKDKKNIKPLYPKLGRLERLELPKDSHYVKFGFRPKGSGSCTLDGIVIGESENSADNCFLSRSGVLVLTNQYPTADNLYRNMFVHKRVTIYKQDGLICDIMKMNKFTRNDYYEFEGINVTEGQEDMLMSILASGSIKTVCVHFLDENMWRVLKFYTDKVRILVWVHGSEIQPWWRREFNFTTKDILEYEKLQSNARMKFWERVFRELDKYPAHFIFVSRYFAEEVFEDYKVVLPTENYSIMHNCIDVDMFEYSPKCAEQRLKLLSIRPYASHKYANDLTVKCIQELSKKPYFDELQFLLIGNGELYDSTLQSLKGYKNVTMEKTFLRQEEISTLYKQFGIFISPTRMDAQGVSRDEAMACGLVPVTNAVTAIPEFVDDSCGILAPGEDWKAMADGIDRLYNDQELFLSMTQNAAARVRKQSTKEFTIDKELYLINKQKI